MLKELYNKTANFIKEKDLAIARWFMKKEAPHLFYKRLKWGAAFATLAILGAKWMAYSSLYSVFGVGAGIFTLTCLILAGRDKFAINTFVDYFDKYSKKNTREIEKALTVDQRNAFKQGCEASVSYLAQAKSWLPSNTNSAFWEPTAYYAGLATSQFVKYAKEVKVDEQSAKEGQEFICKISPR